MGGSKYKIHTFDVKIYAPFLEDQMDPKSAVGGSKPISHYFTVLKIVKGSFLVSKLYKTDKQLQVKNFKGALHDVLGCDRLRGDTIVD